MVVDFTAPLWLWNGKGAWYFVTLPVDQSQIIKMAVPRRGWGSVRVKARIGGTSWATSIFPDSKSGAYLLPVKADVRKAEGLDPGDTVEVSVSVDI
ncbi:MAG: hypothetical protein FD175_2847 [Beijerinckiaceae bacterium]|nr:MAG: hypothetical protein FD175_2847 [Beijerinckiaceae bacterium]